jgi:hypothetical protein
MAAGSSVQPSDDELIELHARTCHTHDDAGRLIATNEPHGQRSPRVFLVWTRRRAIWRVRHDLPAALVSTVADLVAADPPGGDLERPPTCVPAIRAALAEHAPVDDVDDGGPTYCFPAAIADPPEAVRVTGDNAHVLQRWLPAWLPDVAHQLPVLTVVVDGAAVAICACARRPAEATEAGVETHPTFRGRGHAAIATAAWACAMRARGVIPLYSTSWRNTASRRVAAKLGLIQYGASLAIS